MCGVPLPRPRVGARENPPNIGHPRPPPPLPPPGPLQDALEAGKGGLKRDTESGALALDLVRHADVVEYAAWINTFSDTMYSAVWGDKVRSAGLASMPCDDGAAGQGECRARKAYGSIV